MATLLIVVCAARADAAGWTPLIRLAPDFAGVAMLGPDGRVYVWPSSGNVMTLTPDSTGSYINGTWSFIAPMTTPRLYFASHILRNRKIWVLGGEYSGIGLVANWTPTGEIYDILTNTWSPIASYPPEPGCPGGALACFGDDPSMLLPGDKILAGDLLTRTPHIYDITTNTWSTSGSKVYNDQSDEESWVKLSDGTVLTYDLFQSIRTGGAYAEHYHPTTNTWSSLSPSDGTAAGTIPQLSSSALGAELGPLLRLQDGRVFAIGATGHTALYDPAANAWSAGPDAIGTLSCGARLFGADDAPGAVMPNGHVIFAADAGPDGVSSSGNTTTGSNIITGIPSTSCFTVGWAVRGSGIPSDTTIISVDGPDQIHISRNATATLSPASLSFGGVFSNPTQLFDFNPGTNAISPISPSPPGSLVANLSTRPSYVTRMLVLPTGQVLVIDGSRQLWVYTPDGAANVALRPSVTSVTYSGGGVFLLGGAQLNGQNAGSSYGDDAESDENFPIVRLRNSFGQMFYATTFNWSSTGVATGDTPETVNFTLPPGVNVPGNYALQVVGAGIGGVPVFVNITAEHIAGM